MKSAFCMTLGMFTLCLSIVSRVSCAQDLSAKTLREKLSADVKRFGNDGRLECAWDFSTSDQMRAFLKSNPTQVEIQKGGGIGLEAWKDQSAWIELREIEFQPPFQATLKVRWEEKCESVEITLAETEPTNDGIILVLHSRDPRNRSLTGGHRLKDGLPVQGRLSHFRNLKAEAEKLTPTSPWLFFRRSLVHWKQVRLEEAVDDARKALSHKPESKSLTAWLSDITRIASRPSWKKVYKRETPHYVIESDVSAKLCSEMGTRLNYFRRFLEKSFPLNVKQKKPCRVWIFDSEEEYHVFSDTLARRHESSVGVYHTAIKTLLLIGRNDKLATVSTLYHEAFHQYLDLAVANPPIWFNEGMAEYYGATTFDASGTPTEGAIDKSRLAEMREVFQHGGATLFSVIMTMKPDQFMAEGASKRYAQSWAMVHFFKRGPNALARETFATYTKLVLEGASEHTAYVKSFGKLAPETIEELQQHLFQYITELI